MSVTGAGPTYLAAIVVPILRALRLRGIDCQPVIEKLDLDVAGLSNPDSRIPVATVFSLWRMSYELTQDEAFGISAAQQVMPHMLYGFGLAWLSSDTVYDGLKRTARFAKFMASFIDIRLEEEGDYVHLYMGPVGKIDGVAPQARDFAVTMLVRMCRMTLGEDISPARVEIQRPRPENPELWESALSCRVFFGCSVTRITWALKDITEHLVTGNPELARINDE